MFFIQIFLHSYHFKEEIVGAARNKGRWEEVAPGAWYSTLRVCREQRQGATSSI